MSPERSWWPSNADHDPSDGSLAGAFLALILVTPYVSPARQRVQIYTLILIIAFIYSSLLSLFRFKNRGWYSSSICQSFADMLRHHRLSVPTVLLVVQGVRMKYYNMREMEQRIRANVF